MSFAETYRAEVLQSRRDRARKAFFWSRILSVVLMLNIALILRAEPELRRALIVSGMSLMSSVTGVVPAEAQSRDIAFGLGPVPGDAAAPALQPLPAVGPPEREAPLAHLPVSRVKVNRFNRNAAHQSPGLD